MLMLKLAFRNILRNRRRTLLTILSMLGGYVLLAVQLSVTEGSYDQVLDFYTRNTTGHVQVTAAGYIDRPTLYKSIPVSETRLAELMAQPGVEQATARIESSALAYGESESFPVQVQGMDPAREAELSRLDNKVTSGRYFSAEPTGDGYHQAMIGARVARQLSLSVGDELILISQGADGSMANDLYRISAVIGATADTESRWVVLPLAAAQSFYVLPDAAHRVIVMGRDYREAQALAEDLRPWVDRQWPGTDVAVSSWQQVAEEFYNTMQTDKQGGLLTMYVIVLLVGIGVLNTVLMSVMERTGEFGVLKAIGTAPRRLFSLIVLETLLLAGIACAAGLLLALPVNIWFTLVGIELAQPMEISGIVFSHYRGQLSLYVFAFPALVILIASFLTAIFPGLRAARIVPVDAMRTL